MTQMLIGQVYNVVGSDYNKTVNGVKEKRRRVEFRLGQDKPYKVQKVIDGETREVREKTFITVKCFNGLSETIESYFGGEENKGRWIQLTGHFEENKYDKEVEIEDPENEGRVLAFDVPVSRLEFIVSGFSFIGSMPEQKQKPKESTDGKNKVKVKVKTGSNGTSAEDAEKEILDESAPF